MQTTLPQATGVPIFWIQCRCGAASSFFLGRDPMGSSVSGATQHVLEAHHGQDPMKMIQIVADDAAVTRNTRGLDRENPRPWLLRLNSSLGSDF
ncbi:hypothetical protein [Streptomyces sp. NPDC094049]|uniref:hypothetical protein n=1 Tax=Streptomyces sp. NPDC094049 TaxID=3154987 RepID=UPI0033298A19